MSLSVEHLLRTAATLEQAVLALERFLQYRANRNTTAHDYGVGFANETLVLLPMFLIDVRALAHRMQQVFDAQA